MTRLFLFQLGPVQPFIAQARRTQDLFVGSYLLSELAVAGVRAASRLPGFTSIFPMVEGDEVAGGKSPHRFAFLADVGAHDAADAIRTAVYERWEHGFRRPVGELLWTNVPDDRWPAVYDRQTAPEHWLEFYWVAVPYDAGNHGESVQRATAAMAQRRLLRMWPQVEEPGVKCTLTGSQSALPIDWAQLRRGLRDDEERILRSNERLGGMALIKRLAVSTGCVSSEFGRYPSTRQIAADDWNADDSSGIGRELSSYLAVLHMDGDRMGHRLSQLGSVEEHQAFSRRLADFATYDVPEVVNHYGGSTGCMVYSGGDDVLALLPVSKAMEVADTLRQRFFERTGCTASAGIAVTPDTLPLDLALELARDAEGRAKDEYGRNAIVATEAHGTGQLRQAGANWAFVPLLRQLQSAFERGLLSAKLGYDLRVLDDTLFDSTARSERGRQISAINLAEARKAEAARMFAQRVNPAATAVEKDEIGQLYQDLVMFIEDQNASTEPHARMTWIDISNWAVFARFLAQAAGSAARVP